jgi:hypothetical protein
MAAAALQECGIDGCPNLAHSGGQFCAGHAKRKERGQRLDSPLHERLSLRERVSKLCDDLANADSEDDSVRERCWDALEHALRKYAPAVLGRRGGKASAATLSPEERSERARQLAEARAVGLSPARRSEIASIAAQARAARLSPERRREIAKKARAAGLLAQRCASKSAPQGKRRTGGA